jgi:hypothetical protein
LFYNILLLCKILLKYHLTEKQQKP